MDYPGYVIDAFARAADIVAVFARLAALGYARAAGATGFDAALVRLFQSQHADAGGRPLRVDGLVGPLTWGALFGAASAITAARGLAGAALRVAIGQIGVTESPPGSNRGRMVETYLRAVDCPPGAPWCMAFVAWCFGEAARAGVGADPFPRTGGCLDAWHRTAAAAPARIVTRAEAIAAPARVRPGAVFVLDHGGGHGHAGFVRAAAGGALRTVEGNSNPGGGAEGVGVFDLRRRTVMETDLLGFLDFGAA